MINGRNNHSFEKIFGRTETSKIVDSTLYDARDRQNSDSPHKGNIIPYEKSGYHRITTKYIKKVDPTIQTYKLREHRQRDNANEYKFWADYSDQTGDSTSAEKFRNEFEKANSSAKNYKDIIDGEIKTIGNLSDLESELRDSGYDDKYSSKLAERIHGKRIDAAEAANIINKRKENDSKYFEEDLEKEPTKFTNFQRKRKDARMIRRESRKTERSEKWYSVTLTENELKLFSEFLEQREYDYSPDFEDENPEIKEILQSRHDSDRKRRLSAAILGGTIGATIYGTKKYLKKKKAEKELAENKYKTPNKKKK